MCNRWKIYLLTMNYNKLQHTLESLTILETKSQDVMVHYDHSNVLRLTRVEHLKDNKSPSCALIVTPELNQHQRFTEDESLMKTELKK